MTTGDCVQCPGGDNHIHRVNPDPTIREVQVTGDNIVLIPQPLDPSATCLTEFVGIEVGLAEELYQEPDPTARRLVWDPVDCCIREAPFKCPVERFWDSTVSAAPIPDPELDCRCEEDGILHFWTEVNSNCVTHVCLGGEIRCIAGGAAPNTGPLRDKVCYDLSGFNFPVTYGGVGGGQWLVYGTNQMTGDCGGTTATNYADSNASIEYGCWGDTGANPGPAGGWNSVAWQPDTISGGTNLDIIASDSSHGCGRPAFRIDPNFAVGSVGPHSFDFIINSPGPNGALTVGAYDVITGQQLDIIGIQSQPPGGNFSIQPGTNGDNAFSLGTPNGLYSVLFDLTSVAGAQAENVRFLAWNMGNNQSTESLSVETMSAFPQTGSCCLTWPDVNSMLNWMNSIRPAGETWQLEGNSVCTEVAPGVGSVFGTLEGCTGSVDPTVDQVETGNSNPTCTQVVTCTGMNFSATPVGAFFLGCDVVALTGAPEGTYPAACFPVGWEQQFNVGGTIETWRVTGSGWVFVG